MSRLFSLGEVLAATGGRAEGLSGDGICSISIDSREVPPEALFVAIKGDRFDGHDFVRSALDNGAVAALVSQEKAVDLGDRLIVVPDALEGLINLARAARKRSRGAIVAVTGSAGKTTTKEAIRTVLQAAGETHASIQSFNNHWGVPLMLARLPASAQFGVFEIGMNHPGEITPLTQLVRPHVAVITTVAAAHLEFFNSVADIARAKAEIFAGLEPGGTAILNADHEHVRLLIGEARKVGIANVVTCGFSADADWRIAGVESFGARTMAQVVHAGEAFGLSLQVRGRHMVANAVAALATATVLGVGLNVAVTALASFGAPEGRGLTLELGDGERSLLLVDESYNANVASMAAAMEVFSHQKAQGGRKVLVLGDMLELGDQRFALHKSLKDSVLATGADTIFLVGEAMVALADALGEGRVAGHAQRIEDLEGVILNSLAYGDAVMVKGSKGVRLAGLVEKIRAKFQ
jgi:UDP-N-acetylmuramoyl-tripeptide--D-alanyl-D-alanine ligase